MRPSSYLGIEGYEPRWLHGWRPTHDAHGDRLRGLVGRVLTRGRVAWDPPADRWVTECPVLLDFEGEQVEVNHKAATAMSITWNTIDPARPVVWNGHRWVWRDDVAPELVALRGRRVRAVDLLEWHVPDDVDDDEVREVAVAFTIGDTELVVYNEADDTRLRTGPPTAWHRRHRLG
ncbi:hypothetical protein AB0A74_13230 [Saccharothrix sp. NPDC042600]|uniref:hypothetical protein n=1 Tax=Saccharothrix TaxID=2071 RepID=UPI0033FBA4A4|nr:hypothetical protein GCM10017745_38620 [Saccharothrix mutabilis subsp. capreolus]